MDGENPAPATPRDATVRVPTDGGVVPMWGENLTDWGCDGTELVAPSCRHHRPELPNLPRMPRLSIIKEPRAMGAPLELQDPELVTDEVVDEDRPWVVIVWNDPINLMSYVAYVFQKVFGYSKEKANKLMMDVHHKGRAVVSSGTRTEAERDVNRLHGHGLWATMEHDE